MRYGIIPYRVYTISHLCHLFETIIIIIKKSVLRVPLLKKYICQNIKDHILSIKGAEIPYDITVINI